MSGNSQIPAIAHAPVQTNKHVAESRGANKRIVVSDLTSFACLDRATTKCKQLLTKTKQTYLLSIYLNVKLNVKVAVSNALP